MSSRLALPLLAALSILGPSTVAHAQYKNDTVGIDSGYWRVSRPSAADRRGELTTGAPPLRLEQGVRLGAESAFELRRRWWLSTRVSLGFLAFDRGSTGAGATLDERFDARAASTLGTVLGLEGQVGLRYLLATGRARPYVQAALSFLWLTPLSSTAQACVEPCVAGTAADTFLAHSRIAGVHLQPGLELVVRRDVALHLFVDVQRWLVVGAPDNTAVVLAGGIVFFT